MSSEPARPACMPWHAVAALPGRCAVRTARASPLRSRRVDSVQGVVEAIDPVRTTIRDDDQNPSELLPFLPACTPATRGWHACMHACLVAARPTEVPPLLSFLLRSLYEQYRSDEPDGSQFDQGAGAAPGGMRNAQAALRQRRLTRRILTRAHFAVHPSHSLPPFARVFHPCPLTAHSLLPAGSVLIVMSRTVDAKWGADHFTGESSLSSKSSIKRCAKAFPFARSTICLCMLLQARGSSFLAYVQLALQAVCPSGPVSLVRVICAHWRCPVAACNSQAWQQGVLKLLQSRRFAAVATAVRSSSSPRWCANQAPPPLPAAYSCKGCTCCKAACLSNSLRNPPARLFRHRSG